MVLQGLTVGTLQTPEENLLDMICKNASSVMSAFQSWIVNRTVSAGTLFQAAVPHDVTRQAQGGPEPSISAESLLTVFTTITS
jgi:hypothetical protein